MVRIWLATAMSSFPTHLIEGYRTFTSQRLPTEQSRYRELLVRGQAPEVMVIQSSLLRAVQGQLGWLVTFTVPVPPLEVND